MKPAEINPHFIAEAENELPRDEPPLPKTAAAKPPKDRVPLYFGIQLLLLGALLGFLLFQGIRLDRARTLLETQNKQIKTLEERVNQLDGNLGNNMGSLNTEFQNLRQILATRAVEEAVFLKILILKPTVDPKAARIISRHIHRYTVLYGQDPDLVLAIMAIESKFEPNAVSQAGATGLMQVMPQWKQVLGIKEDLKDPETSIKYGLQILGFYQNMYKDIELVLTAYNRGPGPVDMALMRKKSPKNGYSDLVLQTYERLKKLRVDTL